MNMQSTYYICHSQHDKCKNPENICCVSCIEKYCGNRCQKRPEKCGKSKCNIKY